MFGIFKKKDPICGMKEEKGKGLHKHGKWFCSTHCVQEYEKQSAMINKKEASKGGCCH